MALTDTAIRKLKATGAEYQRADGDGLVLVVRAKGQKTWRYEFRLMGKKEKYHYGNYPEITLDHARKIHAIGRQLVQLGSHPASLLDSPDAKKLILDGYGFKEIESNVKSIKEAEAKSALPTFGAVATEYKLTQVDRRWKKPDSGWAPVKKHLLPKLESYKLTDIDVSLFRELIYAVREKSGTATALICRGWGRRIFDYAVEHDYCDHNPALLVRPIRIGKKGKRERWLKAPEIKRYLIALYSANIFRGHKLALHLLLITGLRISELIESRWSDVDFDKGELFIDGTRMKSGKDHLVFLPVQAIAMLSELKNMAAGSCWVFPSDRDSLKHMQTATLRYNHQRVCDDAGIEDYVPHDHRHTVSTTLKERGFSPEAVEITLSHAIPGMSGLYIHAQYLDLRREMLQDWADFLEGLVTEKTVIQANFKKVV